MKYNSRNVKVKVSEEFIYLEGGTLPMEEEPNLHYLLNPPRVVAAQNFLIEVQGVAARYVGRATIEWENYTATALEQWPEIAAEAEEVLRCYPNHPDAGYPQRLLEAARREEIASA